MARRFVNNVHLGEALLLKSDRKKVCIVATVVTTTKVMKAKTDSQFPSNYVLKDSIFHE